MYFNINIIIYCVSIIASPLSCSHFLNLFAKCSRFHDKWKMNGKKIIQIVKMPKLTFVEYGTLHTLIKIIPFVWSEINIYVFVRERERWTLEVGAAKKLF